MQRDAPGEDEQERVAAGLPALLRAPRLVLDHALLEEIGGERRADARGVAVGSDRVDGVLRCHELVPHLWVIEPCAACHVNQVGVDRPPPTERG